MVPRRSLGQFPVDYIPAGNVGVVIEVLETLARHTVPFVVTDESALQIQLGVRGATYLAGERAPITLTQFTAAAGSEDVAKTPLTVPMGVAPMLTIRIDRNKPEAATNFRAAVRDLLRWSMMGGRLPLHCSPAPPEDPGEEGYTHYTLGHGQRTSLEEPGGLRVLEASFLDAGPRLTAEMINDADDVTLPSGAKVQVMNPWDLATSVVESRKLRQQYGGPATEPDTRTGPEVGTETLFKLLGEPWPPSPPAAAFGLEF